MNDFSCRTPFSTFYGLGTCALSTMPLTDTFPSNCGLSTLPVCSLTKSLTSRGDAPTTTLGNHLFHELYYTLIALFSLPLNDAIPTGGLILCRNFCIVQIIRILLRLSRFETRLQTGVDSRIEDGACDEWSTKTSSNARFLALGAPSTNYI